MHSGSLDWVLFCFSILDGVLCVITSQRDLTGKGKLVELERYATSVLVDDQSGKCSDVLKGGRLAYQCWTGLASHPVFSVPQPWLTHLEVNFSRYFRDRFTGDIHASHNPQQGFKNVVDLLISEKLDGKLLAKITSARDFQSLALRGRRRGPLQ